MGRKQRPRMNIGVIWIIVIISFPSSIKANPISWINKVSYVQPEGITRIKVEFECLQTMKELSLEIDLSSLVKDQLDEHAILNYLLMDGDQSEVVVQVAKQEGAAQMMINSSSYSFEVIDSRIRIIWNENGQSTFLWGQEGSHYWVNLYIPTKLNQAMRYGSGANKIAEDSKSYITEISGKTKKLEAILKGKLKIRDAYIKDEVYHSEEYEEVASTYRTELVVQYIGMAEVY
ncbi:MAG: hypothetical protein E7231_07380 [Cellulosilyticum sp.]|nr:hypothetical protein [Cellulosilyticum sp.]